MTCYWDSIYSQLDVEDYKFIGVDIPPNIESLVRLMKSKNKHINNVTWQNSYLSHDEKKEHFTAIDVYNIKGIYKGHLTSVCDSFLLLLCEVFCISVNHTFLNTNIKYENVKKSRKTLRFSSNRGHFQNAGRALKNKSSLSRLERVKQKAISDSKSVNNSKTKTLPTVKRTEKRPSWRADPEGFKIWRQRMRSMKIR
jgi:hypothetical protein